MSIENQDPSSLPSAWEPIKILGTTFLLGGLAGLAALLRSRDELTRRAICSACLNSSLLSMGSAAAWWNYYPNANVIALTFVSIMVGIGGNTSIGIITSLFLKKFNIVVTSPDKKQEKKQCPTNKKT